MDLRVVTYTPGTVTDVRTDTNSGPDRLLRFSIRRRGYGVFYDMSFDGPGSIKSSAVEATSTMRMTGDVT